MSVRTTMSVISWMTTKAYRCLSFRLSTACVCQLGVQTHRHGNTNHKDERLPGGGWAGGLLVLSDPQREIAYLTMSQVVDGGPFLRSGSLLVGGNASVQIHQGNQRTVKQVFIF